MSDVVLDASALIAMLGAEAGGDQVAAALPGAAISSLNLAEVIGKLAERGVPEPEIHSVLDGLGLDVQPFGTDMADAAGLLRPRTIGLGLSLADRACIALASRMARPVLTTDRTWRSLRIRVAVRVIR